MAHPPAATGAAIWTLVIGLVLVAAMTAAELKVTDRDTLPSTVVPLKNVAVSGNAVAGSPPELAGSISNPKVFTGVPNVSVRLVRSAGVASTLGVLLSVCGGDPQNAHPPTAPTVSAVMPLENVIVWLLAASTDRIVESGTVIVVTSVPPVYAEVGVEIWES